MIFTKEFWWCLYLFSHVSVSPRNLFLRSASVTLLSNNPSGLGGTVGQPLSCPPHTVSQIQPKTQIGQVTLSPVVSPDRRSWSPDRRRWSPDRRRLSLGQAVLTTSGVTLSPLARAQERNNLIYTYVYIYTERFFKNQIFTLYVIGTMSRFLQIEICFFGIIHCICLSV